jgi:hypothetical protein
MLLQLPTETIPIQEILIHKNIKLLLKEKTLSILRFQEINTGSCFIMLTIIWENPEKPYIITFGGAFSNHIAAVSAVGNLAGIPTLGIIRGESWNTNGVIIPLCFLPKETE